MECNEISLVCTEKFKNLEEKIEVLEKKMDNLEANNTKANEAIIKTTSILERMEERDVQQDKIIEKLSNAIDKQTEVSYKVNENLTLINSDVKEVKIKVDKLEDKVDADSDKRKIDTIKAVQYVGLILVGALASRYLPTIIAFIENLFK